MRSFLLACLTLAAAVPAASAQDQPPPAPPAANDGPPALPEAPKVEFFVAQNGKPAGPFAIDKVKEMIAAGQIDRATLVWRKGMQNWLPAEKAPEIEPMLAAVPKPVPFDCTGYLVGSWERHQFVNGQQMVNRALYEGNGQVSGVLSVPSLPGVNYYGTWTANAVGEKTCSIAFSLQYPNTDSSTVVVVIDGPDRMIDKAGNIPVDRVR